MAAKFKVPVGTENTLKWALTLALNEAGAECRVRWITADISDAEIRDNLSSDERVIAKAIRYRDMCRLVAALS